MKHLPIFEPIVCLVRLILGGLKICRIVGGGHRILVHVHRADWHRVVMLPGWMWFPWVLLTHTVLVVTCSQTAHKDYSLSGQSNTPTCRKGPSRHTVENKLAGESRISMRIDLQVLNSFDLVITISMMQSDESVSVSVCV